MKTSHAITGLAALVALGVAGGAVAVRRMAPQLDLGVGYAARVACGCRFIEGRPLAQCHDDFEAGMEPIRLAEDARARTVTAWVPLIARRTARYDPLLGCQPEPFAGTPLVVRRPPPDASR